MSTNAYDISKVDIFSIKGLKRGEMSNIISMLLFLYSKFHGNDEISFKYSEIDWLYYHNVSKLVNKLQDLNLVTVLKKPSKQTPFIIKLKPNSELHYILNKDRRLEFHKYNYLSFTKNYFKEAIDCTNLSEHFEGSTVSSWIRNVNSGVWDIYKFLTITKIISYFSCDFKVKTFTVNKYVSRKTPFSKAVPFLYEKIPDNRKEIIYSQFANTANILGIYHDKSFAGMVSAYIDHIQKEKGHVHVSLSYPTLREQIITL